MSENIELKELKRTKWFFEHKKQLRTYLILVLLLLNLVLWGSNIFKFIHYIKTEAEYQEMLKELVESRLNIKAIHQATQPEELLILSETQLPSGSRADLIALIANPNEDWLVKEFNYYFDWGSNRTPTKTSYILPKAQKYLFAPNRTTQGTRANLVITDISWQRVQPKEKKLLTILPAIKISEQKISYPELEKKEKMLKISFDLDNQSVYSFWQLNLDIAIFRGKKIIGFKIFPVYKLKGREKRNIDFIWEDFLELPTHLNVKPEVNLFDPKVFMPPN